MYKFFVEPSQINGTRAVITGSDVNHMKNVLRFKEGKEVMVCDGQGQDWVCSIDLYEEKQVLLKVLHKSEDNPELSVEATLYQGLPKKDKMELVIQKMVELGATEVKAVAMKRSIVKLDAKNQKKKLTRWQGIADAAAKQAKRGIQPKVSYGPSLKAIEGDLLSNDLILVPYENALGITYSREVVAEAKNCARIGIVIGPEGGFEPDEIDYLKDLGSKVITLGRRILRTETAGLALMSYLMIDLEE